MLHKRPPVRARAGVVLGRRHTRQSRGLVVAQVATEAGVRKAQDLWRAGGRASGVSKRSRDIRPENMSEHSLTFHNIMYPQCHAFGSRCSEMRRCVVKAKAYLCNCVFSGQWHVDTEKCMQQLDHPEF